ncbi:Clathrin heavy chain [Carpediemonas membranifera]|uniref:Clathrin heavy chain n=1 Tax=Carpediemonas membranifera TaxID=201153 RepID=A0A8J6E3E6_9EUKA|nr:Clathrin heavy chain [Carpediemonas membranifera]|eukprot:KAG9395516.1 Clathrin heavy chain [Carpediemonas membranifera]
MAVSVEERLQLTSLGIKSESIRFQNVSLQSDKYISVRDGTDGQMNLSIVDLGTQETNTFPNFKADTAIMHVSKKVVALSGSSMIQIMDLDERKKISNTPMNEQISLWRWLDEDTLGVVTTNSVYHLTDAMSANPKLRRMCARSDAIKQAAVMSYSASHDRQWLAISAMASDQGRAVGKTQLYFKGRDASQILDGATASGTGTTTHDGKTFHLLSFVNGDQMTILDVGPKNPDGTPASGFQRAVVKLPLPSPEDFPLTMAFSSRYGMWFVVTKGGVLIVVDMFGTVLTSARIASAPVFAITPASNGGIVGIAMDGAVVNATVDDAVLLDNVRRVDADLATKLAFRCPWLGGARSVIDGFFMSLFQAGDYAKAAALAMRTGTEGLRTRETLSLFQRQPQTPGQPPAVLTYFQTLMQAGGKLLDFETIEIARPMVEQGKTELLEQWIQTDKVTCSETLGNMLSNQSALALTVFLKAQAHHRVVELLAERGEFEKVVAYCSRVNYSGDMPWLLDRVIAARGPVQSIASKLVQDKLMEPHAVVDTLVAAGFVREATAILLDLIKAANYDETTAAHQTKMLAINIQTNPDIAASILDRQILKHFDRHAIATMCERAHMSLQAARLFETPADLRRVLLAPDDMVPDFFAEKVMSLGPENAMDLVLEIAGRNMHAYMPQLVAACCALVPYQDANNLMAIFDDRQAHDGLYQLTSFLLRSHPTEDVTYKYIESAVHLGHVQEVERVLRTSEHIDAPRVKAFLMQTDLSTTLPLVTLCDRFNLVHELVEFMYQRKLRRGIENYVSTYNPRRAPEVVATLLDMEADETFVSEICAHVADNTELTAELVTVTAERNRAAILRATLEQRVASGSRDTVTHSALARILIEAGEKEAAVEFLESNQFYDHLEVGTFCVKRDPHLAILAFSNAPGTECEVPLIQVTNANALFKHQARFLVERQSDALWAMVLAPDNEYREDAVQQVIQVLPDAKTPEQVSTAVKAFMKADIPDDLIALLERIVLESQGKSDFASHASLQNLLVLTAIKTGAEERVMNYIQVLTNFDGAEMASIAVDTELFDVGFAIYSKFGLHVEAIRVLIKNKADIDAAATFAAEVDVPKVWSALAAAQLEAGLVTEAVDSYVKAQDAKAYETVLAAAKPDHLDDLQRYLEMARQHLRDTTIDTELCHVLAVTGQLDKLRELLAGPNVARLQSAGELCYSEGLYEAAKVMFQAISNQGWLADTHLQLHEYEDAVDAARKASSVQTWRKVSRACIDAGRFEEATLCGHQLITNSDELVDLIEYYEDKDLISELIELLETGIAAQRASIEILTSLAVVYSKYAPDKLLDHLKAHIRQVNIAKLIKVCKANEQWPELVFLYGNYEEYENAAIVCMEHPDEAWDSKRFALILDNVTKPDVILRAVKFYLDAHEDLIVDLLMLVGAKVDQAKLIAIVREQGKLPLIRGYVDNVQERDIAVINSARNELLIADGEVDALEASVTTYRNFDQQALAAELKQHEELDFRRIAVVIYQQLGQWVDGAEACKADGMYDVAVDCIADSKDDALATATLEWVVNNDTWVAEGGEPLEAEAADAARDGMLQSLLLRCGSMLEPHVVIEQAWRHKLTDVVMPYLILTVKQVTGRLAELEARVKSPEPAPKAAATAEADSNAFGFFQGADGFQ